MENRKEVVYIQTLILIGCQITVLSESREQTVV